jgi:hypothetical protein
MNLTVVEFDGHFYPVSRNGLVRVPLPEQGVVATFNYVVGR